MVRTIRSSDSTDPGSRSGSVVVIFSWLIGCAARSQVSTSTSPLLVTLLTTYMPSGGASVGIGGDRAPPRGGGGAAGRPAAVLLRGRGPGGAGAAPDAAAGPGLG